MNIFFLFGSAFVVALSGALMPGPLLAVTLGHSPRYGWTFGPLAILGHGILELGLVSVVFLGAGPVLKSHGVQAGVGVAGGFILVWMGWGMFSMVRSGAESEKSSIKSGSGNRPILLGIVTSISNPYWTLWWATVGLAYLMVAAKNGPIGIAVFFLGHISGDLAWYTLVSLGAAKGTQFTGTRIYDGVLYICAFILLILGAWFVWYGMKLLIK